MDDQDATRLLLQVAEAVQQQQQEGGGLVGPWFLAGHSRGGKVRRGPSMSGTTLDCLPPYKEAQRSENYAHDVTPDALHFLGC